MSENTESLVLGIDIGGTKILTAVVNSQGEVLSRDYRLTPARKGVKAVVRAIVDSANRALTQANMTAAELSAIGIGAPGLSDPEAGILYTSPHLPGWQDVPLRDIVGKELGRKAFMANDANAAALGEFYFGAGRGARNLIYITISTGIGGGVIINGELYTGASGVAGEPGHMTIDDKGPLCRCGNTGCWEMLASGTALAREAKQRIREGAETSILNYAGDDVEKVTGEVIHSAAKEGDSLAKELIAQVSYYLGVGLANLVNIFNPELIIIGGGLSRMGDMLLEPAYKVAEERAFEQAYRAVRFSLPELGDDVGVLGAAVFAMREMERIESQR